MKNLRPSSVNKMLPIGVKLQITIANKVKPSTDTLCTAIRRSSIACAALCCRTEGCAGYGFQKNRGNCSLLYATAKTGLQPAEDWKVFLDRSESKMFQLLLNHEIQMYIFMKADTPESTNIKRAFYYIFAILWGWGCITVT